MLVEFNSSVRYGKFYYLIKMYPSNKFHLGIYFSTSNPQFLADIFVYYNCDILHQFVVRVTLVMFYFKN